MTLNRLFLYFLYLSNSLSLCFIFKQIPSLCSLHWNVYFTEKNVSNLECACRCSTTGPCTKFASGNMYGDCVLHSENQPSLFSELPANLLWFGRYPSYNVCPNVDYDYDYYTNTCMRLVDTTASPLTWTSARARCQVEGGDLISLTTKDKVDFVLKYLNCIGNIAAWIGFRQRTWMTGEPVDVSIVESYQLNNYDSHFPEDPDMTCGKLQPWNPKDFQDESCNIRLRDYFICEIIVLK